MTIFLYGKDSYRLKQNLDKIVEEYQKKHPIGGRFGFDLAEHGEAAKFEDSLKSVSFFDEKKLLTVKNPLAAAKPAAEIINKFGLDKDKQTIVVFIETQDEGELIKKDRGLWNTLTAKPNLVKTFEPLEGKKLETWVAKEAIALGCQIEPSAVKKLISCTKITGERNQKTTNGWRLHLELEKLANYKSAQDENSTITNADIDLLVTPAEDLNIFELIDAVANRAKFRAARLLYQNLESGQDPFYIFSMMVYQFRNLLRVKSLVENAVPYQTIIQKTGLNPFVVKKTYDQCKKYDLRQLQQLFSRLSSFDIQAKSGEIEMSDAIFQFATSI